MKTKDGRSLSHETLEELRIQAIKAVIERKQSPEKVMQAMGFHRENIYN